MGGGQLDVPPGALERRAQRHLVDLLSRLQGYITTLPGDQLAEPGRWEQAIAEHTAMVDAIEARDEPTARRIAEEHMTTARAIRLRHALAGLGW